MNPLWQTQLRPDQPGFWLLLALFGWAMAAVANRRLAAGSQPIVAAARWLVIPYGALLSGAVSPRLMGLTLIDWRVTIGFGLTIVVGLVAVVGLAAAHHGSMTPNTATATPARSWTEQIGLGVIQQFYWCFLRGAVGELFILSAVNFGQAEYWANWLAAFLVLPDLPARSGTPVARLSHVTALVVTTVLFIYTRNFWLCALAHSAILTIFRVVLSSSAGTSTTGGRDPLAGSGPNDSAQS